jgi:hypothetical protein
MLVVVQAGNAVNKEGAAGIELSGTFYEVNRVYLMDDSSWDRVSLLHHGFGRAATADEEAQFNASFKKSPAVEKPLETVEVEAPAEETVEKTEKPRKGKS